MRPTRRISVVQDLIDDLVREGSIESMIEADEVVSTQLVTVSVLFRSRKQIPGASISAGNASPDGVRPTFWRAMVHAERFG